MEQSRRNNSKIRTDTRDYVLPSGTAHVEGNLAVREDDWYFEKRRSRIERQRIDRIQQRAARKYRYVRAFAAIVIASAIIGSCMIYLQAYSKNRELNESISSLESHLAELTEENNSREYDIASSVDLNYVIQVASDELGMVRSSAGQIVIYKDSTSEYVQQVGDIPTD